MQIPTCWWEWKLLKCLKTEIRNCRSSSRRSYRAILKTLLKVNMSLRKLLLSGSKVSLSTGRPVKNRETKRQSTPKLRHHLMNLLENIQSWRLKLPTSKTSFKKNYQLLRVNCSLRLIEKSSLTLFQRDLTTPQKLFLC